MKSESAIVIRRGGGVPFIIFWWCPGAALLHHQKSEQDIGGGGARVGVLLTLEIEVYIFIQAFTLSFSSKKTWGKECSKLITFQFLIEGSKRG